MAAVLIFSEKTRLVRELATAARELGRGGNALAVDQQQAAELAGSGIKTYYINCSELPIADTAGMAAILQQAADKLGAETVLLSSNRRGKELAGRLAQAWGAGCLTDVKGFRLEGGGRDVFVRNTLGGATVATQAIKSTKQVIAFSPRAFTPFEGGPADAPEVLEMVIPVPSIRVLETRNKIGDTVDIQAAERLVIVGQGLENREDMELVEKIAKALGAEIACSKPVASDKKWLPEDRVVGLSGKICKPALALILGVSGQVQFTVGVRDAQVIISINNDENAYINQISDYCLAADLKAAVPELLNALE